MSPQYWSKRMGRKLYKTDIFRSLADFEEQATLTDGQKVNRPYRADIVVENYTKGTALTAQDLTATDDILTVNIVKAALFYVDNVDKIQNKYSAANLWIDEAGRRLSNAIDARFLYEAFSANNTVDDGTIGGVSGNGITTSSGNILDIFASINQQLDIANVEEENRFLALSPNFYQQLWRYIAGKVTMLGDKTGQNGNIGQYAGLQLFKTNNLTGSATWTPVADPSDGDTITIAAVVFTWKTTIGTTAGNILRTGVLATDLTTFTAFINAAGVTVDAGVSAVTQTLANQRIMQNWVAVATSTTLEVRVQGGSYISVSSTGGNTTTTWTSALQIQNLFAGRFGCTDAVIQKEPSVEMGTTVGAGKSGMNILPITLFGVYTFHQGANEMVHVKVRSDGY